MLKPLLIFFLSLLLLVLLLSQTNYAQNKISAGVISSGGTKISNSNFFLNSTIGESFIGKTSGTANQHNVGFWDVYKQNAITKVEKEDETIPTSFKLEQNFPNPFNPSTIIKFGVPERSSVVIKIFDILGGEVMTLINEEMEAGWYSREFNAPNYSSGIYIYRMQAGTYVNTRKMILIK